jgi:hypothetical protein
LDFLLELSQNQAPHSSRPSTSDKARLLHRAYVSRMPLSKKGCEIALFLLYYIRQED